MTGPVPVKRSAKAMNVAKAVKASATPAPVAAVVEPPSNLQEPGRALWLALTADTEFTPVELVILAAACQQQDDIARLEVVIRDGVIVAGSTGQARLSQCVTEVRQGRLALAKLLDQLNMPEADEEVGRTPTSRRAQHAANTRWRRLTVAKDRRG